MQRAARTADTSLTIPDPIESPTAKLLYTYIATHGAMPAGEIADALDLSQLTIHSILGELEGHGVVSRTGDTVAVA
jgi:predicted ArsR family transcriptional regulator